MFGIYSESSNHCLTPQLALGSINYTLNLALKMNKKIIRLRFIPCFYLAEVLQFPF